MKLDSLKIVRDFVTKYPGVTAIDIGDELSRHTRIGKWFGERSVLAVLFAPNPYVIIASLERSGDIYSAWGSPGRGGFRPRYYYPKVIHG